MEAIKGQRVTHILPSGKSGKYGQGTILDVLKKEDSIHVCVQFDNVEGVKSFVYPDCFGRYLRLEDPKLEEQLEEIKSTCTWVKENIRKKNNMTKLVVEKKESTNAILAELDSLVGLDEVKRDVRVLASFIQVNNLRRNRGLKAPAISKHLVLTGNPGTGKTTVARLISRIYYSIGAIPKNNFVETSRAGLVAGYVGQTALKTQDVIEKAMGGVLFIDEAYSLVSDSKNDYGSEAIDTLISAMENNRDNLVVIVAGYEEPMQQFIGSNPGLSSRFNRYLHFKDYDSEELMSIFLKLCEENEYILQEEAESAIHKFLKNVYARRCKDFGNARTVRNIFEKIIAYQAERIISLDSIDDDDLLELTLADVENALSQVA